jgi:hypothetical protein
MGTWKTGYYLKWSVEVEKRVGQKKERYKRVRREERRREKTPSP